MRTRKSSRPAPWGRSISTRISAGAAAVRCAPFWIRRPSPALLSPARRPPFAGADPGPAKSWCAKIRWRLWRRSPGSEITSAGTITIKLSPLGEQQIVDAAVAVTRIRSGTALVNASLNGSVAYNLETETLATDLTLTDIDDRLRLVAGGTVGDQTMLTLRTLEGRWTNMPIRLLQPAEIRSGGGRILLAPAVLDVSGGRLELSGEQVGTALTARATLGALPVGPLAVLFDWPAEAEGHIDGTAEVTFAPDSARGRVVITANDLAFAGQERGLEPADLSLAADWDGRLLNLTGQITGLDSAPAVLSGSMPLVRRPGSFAVDIPEHGPVTGSFTAVARAERLFALLPLPEHRLAGALSVSLAVSGDIAQPNISGRALLDNATYESLELGTRLEALHLALEATPDGALSLAANASDGGDGRSLSTGALPLPAGAPPSPRSWRPWTPISPAPTNMSRAAA